MTKVEFSRMLSHKALELLREMPPDIVEKLAELVDIARKHQCDEAADRFEAIRQTLNDE